MRIREGVELLRSKEGREWVRRTLRKRLYSRHESTCLRRDLTVPFTPPKAKIPLEIRLLRPDDDLALIADEPGLSPEVRRLRTDQRWMLTRDLPKPWVAVGPDGTVCMMTWLFTARDNAQVKALWGDWLPELKPDEAMIEGIFTSAAHRGMGIMPDAGTRITEQARDQGVRYGLGFIPMKNASSLKAGDKSGWFPHMKRVERWVLFRRSVEFLPLSDAGD